MKYLFMLLRTILAIKDQDPIEHNKLGIFTIYDVSRIIRQYVSIFNILDISSKDRILIVAPNSMSWLFLLITSMAKRFKIYIVSARESITNIKIVILEHNINFVFTDKRIAGQLLSENIQQMFSLKSIINMGTIYNGSLLGTDVLFYDKHYSTSVFNEREFERISKIKIVPQLQGIDDDQLIDWAKKFENETELYEINVFTEEGVTKRMTHNRYDGLTFEKVINKIRLNFKRSISVSLSLDYADWVPLIIGVFTSSARISTRGTEVYYYDNYTFMDMWKEVIDSEFQDTLIDSTLILFPFIKTWYVKRKLKAHLGDFKQLYILNGHKLPVHVKRLLIRSKLPIATTYGTIYNGYVSYLNEGEQIMNGFGKEIVEDEGDVKLVNINSKISSNPYNSREDLHLKVFEIQSTTDCVSTRPFSRNERDVMYNKTTISKKFLWFKQKATTITKYAGRFIDTISVGSKEGLFFLPSTAITSLIESVRLFNTAHIVSFQGFIHAIIEINQTEKESLGYEKEELDAVVKNIIGKINSNLQKELQINSFELVDESNGFVKTRNKSIKSCLYLPR